MKDLAVIILLAVVGFTAGYWSATVRYAPPSCPQEDSCRADYSSGSWHIIPIKP